MRLKICADLVPHHKYKQRKCRIFVYTQPISTVMLKIGDKMPAFEVLDQDGKTTMGTLRRTFIFSDKGILERIIEKVDTKNAAAQILNP